MLKAFINAIGNFYLSNTPTAFMSSLIVLHVLSFEVIAQFTF